MKKILIICLAIAMLISLVACSAPAIEEMPEPTPEATPEPTPEAAPEPTPEPEPTPVPIKSRQDLLDIGFELLEGSDDIFVIQSKKIFSTPIITAYFGGEINPHEGFLIDYSKGRIAIDSFSYDELRSDQYEQLEQQIQKTFEDFGFPDVLTPEQEEILDEMYEQLFAMADQEQEGHYVLRLEIDERTGTLWMNPQLSLNAEQLECVLLEHNMRYWNVFLIDKKDELGYSFIRRIDRDDIIIDGYAIYTDMQQDGYVSPQKLRTDFGMAGLSEDLEQRIIDEAYVQYENAKAGIEKQLGISIAGLLALE